MSESKEEKAAWDPERSVCIVNIEEDGTFVVHEEHLKHITEELVQRKCERVSVVSLAGAFRMGKSFLLDLFLRFLRHQEANGWEYEPSNSKFPAWWSANSGMLTRQDDLGDLEQRKGFKWRHGTKRETTGVWMYGRPFVQTIQVSAGHNKWRPVRVGILLMDTQGMFDMQSSEELSPRILGLAAMLSSHFVYNVHSQFQMDKIRNLEQFFSLMKAAQMHADGVATEFLPTLETDDEAKESKSGKSTSAKKTVPVVQEVMFLVRDGNKHLPDPPSDDEDEEGEQEPGSDESEPDELGDWLRQFTAAPRYLRRPEDKDYGLNAEALDMRESLKSMQELFDWVLNDKKTQSEESAPDGVVLKRIRKHTSNASCFVLAHPGKSVERERFAGNLMKVESQFAWLVHALCIRLFGSEFVSVKQTTPEGFELTPKMFGEYVMDWVNVFKGDLPDHENYLLLKTRCVAGEMVDESLTKYEKAMDSLVGGKAHTVDSFEQAHKQALKRAQKYYLEKMRGGTSDIVEKFRKKLVAKAASEKEKRWKMNQNAGVPEFQAFVYPMILALLMLLLDKLSDVVCDSWSETCVKFSKLASILYWAVFGVFTVMIGKEVLDPSVGLMRTMSGMSNFVKQLGIEMERSARELMAWAQGEDRVIVEAGADEGNTSTDNSESKKEQ